MIFLASLFLIGCFHALVFLASMLAGEVGWTSVVLVYIASSAICQALFSRMVSCSRREEGF